MRARRLLLVVVAATLLTTAWTAVSPARADAAARADEYVIGAEDLTPALDTLLTNAGAIVLRDNTPFYVLIDTSSVVDLPFVTNDGVPALLDAIRALAGVRFVEPHFVYNAAAPDPELGQQLNLESLEVTPAWGTTSGAGVTIGVADTGVDLSHPDLTPALVGGANFVDRGAPPADDGGHGTEVAGLAAARGDNGIGIAGVAYQASIMPLKVLRGDGSGVVTDIADALRHSSANGVKVVNLSLIGTDASDTLREAIAQAEASNVVIVVAAGNQGIDIDQTPMYPAGYPNGNIISVAAEQTDRVLAEFSNRGPGNVDVTAPGVTVRTTERGGGYGYVDGTSMSAPQVAGAIALLASAHPEWNAAQLRDALFAGAAARPVPGVGRGAVSVARSLGLSPAASGGGAGGSGGGGAGAGGTGGSGFAGGNGTATRQEAARLGGVAAAARNGLTLVLRAATPTRVPRRGATVRLRWRALGATANVRRYRVVVDGRRMKPVSRRITDLRVKLRPGRHRWSLTALDARGRSLVRVRTSFSLRRAT
jgi:subtilisin family serine protease